MLAPVADPVAARATKRVLMSGSALILAAHGSAEEPSVNQSIKALADRLARRGAWTTVAAAFHRGHPSIGAVLDGFADCAITVVPFMSSEGYFTDVVLRGVLNGRGRSGHARVRQTPPVGTHPFIAVIVAQRVETLISENDLDAKATTVAVIGHGSRRHTRSRSTTLGLVDALRRHGAISEVLPAFLDDDPGVETIRERSKHPHVVVVPFLMAAGPHAVRDIPVRLGMTPPDGAAPPFRDSVGEKLVICDVPVGTDPKIASIIADLAEETQ